MFTKLISYLGSKTAEIKHSFAYGYNSVQEIDVVAKLNGTDDNVAKVHNKVKSEAEPIDVKPEPINVTNATA